MGQERILKGFDEFSNYVYHDAIEEAINRRKLRALLSSPDTKAIKNNGLDKLFDSEVTTRRKVKYFLFSHFSWIYLKVKKIRNKLRNIEK